MLRRNGWSLVLLLLLPGCDPAPETNKSQGATPAPSSSVVADTPDQAKVRKVLEGYKTAVYARQGEAAVLFVSKRTFAYFEKVKGHALDMKADDVKGLPMFDRLMVITLRARLDKETVEKSSGEDLVARGIKDGWTGAVARNFAAGDIKIVGDEAQMFGKKQPWQEAQQDRGFRAYREDGEWKIDVVSVATLAAGRMEKQLTKIDPDPNKALIKLTGQLMKKELPETIWDPLR